MDLPSPLLYIQFPKAIYSSRSRRWQVIQCRFSFPSLFFTIILLFFTVFKILNSLFWAHILTFSWEWLGLVELPILISWLTLVFFFPKREKNVLVIEKSWRPRICKIFAITRTIYSNSERSLQFLKQNAGFFFLAVGQNNFGNKTLLTLILSCSNDLAFDLQANMCPFLCFVIHAHTPTKLCISIPNNTAD